MNKITETEKCYGCGACANICPKGCITMEFNELGFLYPTIDQDQCIECRLCQQRCIGNQKYLKKQAEPDIYVGVHRKEEVWMNSSSGGAFTAIVEALYDNNTVIFGAAYDKDLNVKHMMVDDLDHMKLLRKSKYVQSQTEVSYRLVKQYLDQGKRVIYSGTPCQIAGLYAVLNKDYENLFTIDLVCTGVCSPGIFKKNTEFLSEKYKKNIKKLDMRYKIKNKDGWNIGDTEVTFEDDTKIRNQDTRLYRYLYGQKLAFRESCYQCDFASISRMGDFTIGDWWGSIEGLADIKEHKGISVIMFNSDKGKAYLKQLKQSMYLIPKSKNELIKDNPTFSSSTKKDNRRNSFIIDYNKISNKRLLKRYARPEMKRYIIWLISRVIPRSLRERIKVVGIKRVFKKGKREC